MWGPKQAPLLFCKTVGALQWSGSVGNATKARERDGEKSRERGRGRRNGKRKEAKALSGSPKNKTALCSFAGVRKTNTKRKGKKREVFFDQNGLLLRLSRL